jgi:hypothetical protein
MTVLTLPSIARDIEAQILKGCGATVEWFFRGGDEYTLIGSADAVLTAASFCESNGLAKLTEAIHYDEETEEAYGWMIAA